MSFTSPNKDSQRGFTLVEVLASLGILMIAAMALSTIVYQGYLQSSKNSMLSGADVFRRSLNAVVSNDIAWVNTIARNPQMAQCLSGANCNASYTNVVNAPLFDLYDASNTLVYRPRSDARAGINSAGVPCTGFDYMTTNPSCPMRFELKWFALSTGVKPQVGVVATLILSRDSNFKINLNHYSIGACSNGIFNGVGQFICGQYNNFLLRSTY